MRRVLRNRRRWLSLLLIPVLAQQGVAHAQPTGADHLLPESVVTWYGQNQASAGSAMANTACDYNGDGLGDIIASDWMWQRTEAGKIGTSYIIPSGDRDLTGGDLDSAESGAYRFEGGFTHNLTGFTVSCAGDVDGDGHDDLAYSDYTGNRLHVLFGEDPVQNRSLQYPGGRSLTIQGLPGGRTSNYSAGVGDVNGDGFGDVAVVTKNSGEESSGRIDIVAGGDDTTTVQLPAGTGEDHPRLLTTIVGVSPTTSLTNVAPAGDVNGDGLQDLVITGYTAVGQEHPEGTRVPGMAWILYGQEEGMPRTVDLADLGDRGFTVSGPARGGDRLGISVTTMGDVNGDGFDDLLLGADSTGATAGAGVVVLGAAGSEDVLTDPGADPSVHSGSAEHRGWWLEGREVGDRTGYAVAARPGTYGRPPLIVLGAYAAGENEEGAVHIIDAGQLDPAATTLTVAELEAAGAATTIEGDAPGQRLGRAVASLGDFNGDGTGDLAWGGDGVNSGRGVISLAVMPGSRDALPGEPQPGSPSGTPSSFSNSSNREQ